MRRRQSLTTVGVSTNHVCDQCGACCGLEDTARASGATREPVTINRAKEALR
jgi:hypothetical protein